MLNQVSKIFIALIFCFAISFGYFWPTKAQNENSNNNPQVSTDNDSLEPSPTPECSCEEGICPSIETASLERLPAERRVFLKEIADKTNEIKRLAIEQLAERNSSDKNQANRTEINKKYIKITGGRFGEGTNIELKRSESNRIEEIKFEKDKKVVSVRVSESAIPKGLLETSGPISGAWIRFDISNPKCKACDDDKDCNLKNCEHCVDKKCKSDCNSTKCETCQRSGDTYSCQGCDPKRCQECRRGSCINKCNDQPCKKCVIGTCVTNGGCSRDAECKDPKGGNIGNGTCNLLKCQCACNGPGQCGKAVCCGNACCPNDTDKCCIGNCAGCCDDADCPKDQVCRSGKCRRYR